MFKINLLGGGGVHTITIIFSMYKMLSFEPFILFFKELFLERKYFIVKPTTYILRSS